MKKNSLLLSALLAFAAFSVQAADEPAKAPAPVKKQARQQVYGYQMMTPAERTEYRSKMRAAKTPEERQQICEDHHAQMQERAKEKGMTLPEAPRCGAGGRMGGRGGRMGPGGGMGGGMGPGGGGMMQNQPAK